MGKAFRATFEDVMANQRELIGKLNGLIADGRPLAPEERIGFMDTLARSTLGLGTRVELNFDGRKELLIKPVDDTFPVKDAEGFIRFLVFFEGKSIGLRGKEVPISKFWSHARSLVLLTIPLALERASQMSVERVPYERLPPERV